MHRNRAKAEQLSEAKWLRGNKTRVNAIFLLQSCYLPFLTQIRLNISYLIHRNCIQLTLLLLCKMDAPLIPFQKFIATQNISLYHSHILWFNHSYILPFKKYFPQKDLYWICFIRTVCQHCLLVADFLFWKNFLKLNPSTNCICLFYFQKSCSIKGRLV